MPTGIDPRYDDYKTQAEPEVFECGLCNEKFDTELDTWVTTLGTLKVCAYCFDYNSQNDTHILIELKGSYKSPDKLDNWSRLNWGG